MTVSNKVDNADLMVLGERVARVEERTLYIADTVKHLDECLDDHKSKQATREEVLEERERLRIKTEADRERKQDRLWFVLFAMALIGPFLAGTGKMSLSALLSLFTSATP